jgi:hypothetical protein
MNGCAGALAASQFKNGRPGSFVPEIAEPARLEIADRNGLCLSHRDYAAVFRVKLVLFAAGLAQIVDLRSKYRQKAGQPCLQKSAQTRPTGPCSRPDVGRDGNTYATKSEQ